jgi:vacuolar-type H+-ATPase subunit E/Vma4
MASSELIERLHREADERARAIRKEAEEEAEGLRAESRRKTEALALRYQTEEAAAVSDKIMEKTMEAEAESRALQQAAVEVLAGRLRAAASSALSELRERDYEGTFRALTAELPPSDWKVVRVNPADEVLAEEVFPGAKVVVDSGITGGMEVASGDGRVRVVNTFDKRLERAWEEILPGLVAEAYGA